MKGKQAALADRRRLEAANDLIDRLTDQVAEAKLRARRVEADARQVPALRRQVAELTRQVEEDERLHIANCRIAELERTVAVWRQARKAYSRLLADLMERVAMLVEIPVANIIEEFARRHPGAVLEGESAMCRTTTERSLSNDRAAELQTARGVRMMDEDGHPVVGLQIGTQPAKTSTPASGSPAGEEQ